MPVITISRQLASFGNEIAAALSQKLGWEIIYREELFEKFIAHVANRHELHMLKQSAKFFLKQCRYGITFLEYIDRELHAYAKNHPVVLVGFGSQVIFCKRERRAAYSRDRAQKRPHCAHQKRYHVSDEEAEQILTKADLKQKRFVSTIFEIDLKDPTFYNVTFNTGILSIDECTASIHAMLKERELLIQMEEEEPIPKWYAKFQMCLC